MLLVLSVVSGRPAAARALRRAATVILTYPLGGIVDITFISLACACAAAPFFPLTEVVLWLPPLLALGGGGGGDYAPFFAAGLFAGLSAAGQIYESLCIPLAADVLCVAVLCVSQTFPGIRWATAHCPALSFF
jgi:hypothetical protein